MRQKNLPIYLGMSCMPRIYQKMLKSDKVAQGILNALDKLKKTSVDRRLAKLTGTSAIRYCTEISYEVHFRGLTKFFKLIGDYESLLMLRDKCPANCPSMKVESLVMYVWWKYNASSMTLLDLGGKEVYDVMGHLIKCRGDWNAPEKRKGFRTFGRLWFNYIYSTGILYSLGHHSLIDYFVLIYVYSKAKIGKAL